MLADLHPHGCSPIWRSTPRRRRSEPERTNLAHSSRHPPVPWLVRMLERPNELSSGCRCDQLRLPASLLPDGCYRGRDCSGHQSSRGAHDDKVDCPHLAVIGGARSGRSRLWVHGRALHQFAEPRAGLTGRGIGKVLIVLQVLQHAGPQTVGGSLDGIVPVPENGPAAPGSEAARAPARSLGSPSRRSFAPWRLRLRGPSLRPA